MSVVSEIHEQVVSILQKANYKIFENATPDFDMCFEILAQHQTQDVPNLIIKILDNIDAIRPHFIHEIKLLSKMLHAVPLIIGHENRRNLLENDSVYIRKDLCALNVNTFQKIIHSSNNPLYFAKKGGYFIDINGDRLMCLRKKMGLSRKDLAEKLQVSAKTIAHYEKNEMRTSKEHATQLQQIFGESLIIPLDLLSHLTHNQPEIQLNEKLQRKITMKLREFVELIDEIVEQTGYKSFWLRASVPFDIFIYKDEEETHKITEYGFIGGTQTKLKVKPERKKLQQVLLENMPKNQESGLIVDQNLEEKPQNKYYVPYIFPEELRLLENPKEFRKLIKKRDRRV